ncbi:RING-type domain-containing protein [Mycena venus]|uniref:RING-type domain-containing protein n=1 Tax=Mycena venus TaxID=2733690 RepID=A0A8H6X6R6_9AGAR|nr:RING-type domain-containing protein [Mycena venus]
MSEGVSQPLALPAPEAASPLTPTSQLPAGSQGNPWLVSDSPPPCRGSREAPIDVEEASPRPKKKFKSCELRAVRARIQELEGSTSNTAPRPEAATSSARGSPRMGDTNLQPGPFVTLHSRAGRATILVTDHPLQSSLNLRPRPGPIGSHSGWRRSTARGVAQSQLLLSGPKPPTLTAKEPHHKCSICHCVKTHPVSTQCGHTHCFVCIRVWLQTSWKCPDCNTVMHSAPSRNYDLEEWLRISYPEIAADESRVTYSWSGLVFPTAN